MKKLKTSFKTALLVSLSLNLAGMIYTYFFHGGWEEIQKDLVRIYPISFPIFFFPPFISLYLFQKDKKFFFQFLKPAIFSFIVVFFVVFLNLYFSNNIKDEFPFFPTVFNGIIAFFLSVFFSVLEFIKENKKKNIYKLSKNINYRIGILIAIPIGAAIIYAIIFYISYGTINYRQGRLFFLSKFITPGIIVSFSTVYFLNYFYKNMTIRKRKISIIVMYFFLTTFFPLLAFFDFYFGISYDRLRHDSKFQFLEKVLQIVIIFSPYFLFITSFVHLYFLQLLNKQELTFIKKESLESQLNYQQLKNQLSPHFLFNNINVLTALIEENPKKAVGFSESLSAIYRYFLEQEKQDVILLSNELKFAKDYLFLLQSRFENGLTFTFDVENSSEEKFIVATTLQQVLENVIKHNEVSIENPVEVSITSENDYLVVKNNINKKISTTEGFGKGIDNIKKRYAYFSDEKVVVLSEKDFFTISLPLLTQ